MTILKSGGEISIALTEEELEEIYDIVQHAGDGGINYWSEIQEVFRIAMEKYENE